MNHTHMDDPTLVTLTLAGDPSAYEELVIRYQSAAIGAATRVIGSRYLAEDAAQDAFVTAWMKLNTLREPEKFGVWVCRIARNCAFNMRTRFRDYLPEETMETVPDDSDASPEEILIRSEEESLLHASIGRLPKKTAEIIRLHYFEGLSIPDIAEMLRLTEGTVKWRLHDGRQRLREDLSAMNENENDTLVQRVMKKVEELKLWKLKSDKTGFETVYEDVLSDVENLPESSDKYHMMADVLVRGFWWIPGKQNDALFAAIRETAERGRNEDVMIFVIGREYSKVPHGKDRIEFILDKQIPRLEALDLPHTLAYAWFWLGYEYHRVGDAEAGFAAYDKVQDMLTPADIYYAAAISAARLERELTETKKKLDERNYIFGAGGDIYRITDGELQFAEEKGYSRDNCMPGVAPFPEIWFHASLCGRFFFHAKKSGESITDENGRTLTYGGAGHTIVTPAGKFDDCILWIVDGGRYYGQYETYYKSGIGIVRQDHIDTYNQNFRTTYHLSEYGIVGGSGLLPTCAGNRWSYVCNCDPAYFEGLSTVEITHANTETVVASTYVRLLRYGFNPDSWRDMALAVRSQYFMNDDHNGKWHLVDVRPQMERMKKLQKLLTSLPIAGWLAMSWSEFFPPMQE